MIPLGIIPVSAPFDGEPARVAGRELTWPLRCQETAR
jgi:hypothetical protein